MGVLGSSAVDVSKMVQPTDELGGHGVCSSSFDCSGGGGQCGSSFDCTGGGGKCGSSFNCGGR